MPTNEHLFQPPDNNPDDDSLWTYTMDATEFAAARQARERKGDRTERPAIGRDSPIDGGTYEGAYGGEAIVVDKEKYPHGYKEAMDKVQQRMTLPDGSIDKALVLRSVYDVVDEMMRYDQAAVDAIYQKENGYDGMKVALDYYIREGVGVCRHQALFAGQLLEGLADQGIIRGQASVDRNMVRAAGDRFDGHAWVRYTNSAGEIFILDVAQHKLESLDELMTARSRGEKVWDYARPEDKVARRTRGIGGGAAQFATHTDEQGIIDKLPWDNK